jgi:UDP-N-acetylmuramoyl-tripeptide--D-alanyl-D-alanine ligase
MLQQSEYHPAEYLAWYHRTTNFAQVERRGHLVFTAKSAALLTLAAGIYLALAAGSVILGATLGGAAGWVAAPVGLVGLIATPFLTAYALLVPLVLGRILVQIPLERRAASRTRTTLTAHHATRIAVAGSFGKTSLREILRTILAEGRRVAAPPHSFNTPAGIAAFVAGLSGQEEVLIFELGEYYPGDVRQLCELTMPHIGIITGINEAHLDKFKRLDRTAATIYELADWLGGQPTYVNGESHLAQAAARSGHLVYSREGAPGWRVHHAATGLSGTTFELQGNGERLHLHTQLLGLHQIGPIVVAIDIATRLGLTPEQITRGVAELQAFDHRLQPSTDAHGVTLLDESYNGNPDGVAAVIAFLTSLTDHRRFYITPGLVEMGERSAAVHRHIGEQLAKAGIEYVVLIDTSAAPHIAAGLRAAGFKGQLIHQPDMLAALAALPHLTLPGDVVLIQNDWPDQYR